MRPVYDDPDLDRMLSRPSFADRMRRERAERARHNEQLEYAKRAHAELMAVAKRSDDASRTVLAAKQAELGRLVRDAEAAKQAAIQDREDREAAARERERQRRQAHEVVDMLAVRRLEHLRKQVSEHRAAVEKHNANVDDYVARRERLLAWNRELRKWQDSWNSAGGGPADMDPDNSERITDHEEVEAAVTAAVEELRR